LSTPFSPTCSAPKKTPYQSLRHSLTFSAFWKSVTSHTARVSIRIPDTVKTETQIDYETLGFNNESRQRRKSKDV
jgi:hypothetical protein